MSDPGQSGQARRRDRPCKTEVVDYAVAKMEEAVNAQYAGLDAELARMRQRKQELDLELKRLTDSIAPARLTGHWNCGHATDATDHPLPAARCKVSAREALIRRGMASWRPKCNVRCLKIKPVSPGKTAISTHGIRSGGCPIRKIGKTDMYNPDRPHQCLNNFHSGRGISSGRFETATFHRVRCPWKRRIYLKEHSNNLSTL